MTGHAINAPSATIFPRNEPVSIPAEGSLGFSSKSAASAGSMPIAIAGSESVSKLIKADAPVQTEPEVLQVKYTVPPESLPYCRTAKTK